MRRARAEDKAAILAFATRTWDGWDYIPEAWDAWLAAADGTMLVVVAGEPVATPEGTIAAGQPIALSRLALLAKDHAWLEGIRVDPRVRGRGVATALQVAELAWVRAQGASWVRYATGEENEGSHRLGARHGIRVLCAWRWYARRRDEEAASEAGTASVAEGASDAPPDPSGPTAVDRHLLAPDTPGAAVDRLWRLIDTDPTFALGQRLYECRSWAFQPLTSERFAAHVRAAEVHVSADRGAVVITPHRAGWNEDHRPHVALVAGDGEAALALLVARRDAFGGRLNLRLPWPDPPLLRDGIGELWAAAGFGSWGTHSLHVLGRALDGAEGEDSEGVQAVAEQLTFLEPPRRIATPQAIGG
ncbi:MAG: GNAT family N-acetyltransferase [Chloroflexota bacterium]|nr:MAG: GNAT family N-acetyltransferase [Chloroflexota bacterium]